MDGTALVFCEGAFGLPAGKTANGLVRFGTRYDILGVVDSEHAGRDAGEVVPGVTRRNPVFASVHQAVEGLGRRPDYLVVGLDPPDGRFPPQFRRVIRDSLRMGISVDSALRPFLHEDAEFPGLAQQASARIRSVGFPKALAQLRSYSGEIERVAGQRVAVVGTHSVVGKRTTTVRLTKALLERGVRAEMIGTGTSSWFQGVRSTVILESVLSRYVAGELEGAIIGADAAYHPEVFVLEGQGSVLNPANPSGIELLTTARPDAIVMQHAIQHEDHAVDDPFGAETLEQHIRVAELLSGSRVVAITLNPEIAGAEAYARAAELIRKRFDLLITDVLHDGTDALADVVCDRCGLGRRSEGARTHGRS
jgi:uncharacterized NAD-dependent epimerase/dehydratase family protein